MTVEKKAGRGGKRKGAGRKSKWLPGTELKTMRLPACLEKELFDYAQRRMTQLNYQSRGSSSKRAENPVKRNYLLYQLNLLRIRPLKPLKTRCEFLYQIK